MRSTARSREDPSGKELALGMDSEGLQKRLQWPLEWCGVCPGQRTCRFSENPLEVPV